MPPNFKTDVKLQLAPSNFIVSKRLDAAPDTNVNFTSALLHIRKQQIMSSVAFAIEKLRASGDNVKLLFPLTICVKHLNRLFIC